MVYIKGIIVINYIFHPLTFLSNQIKEFSTLSFFYPSNQTHMRENKIFFILSLFYSSNQMDPKCAFDMNLFSYKNNPCQTCIVFGMDYFCQLILLFCLFLVLFMGPTTLFGTIHGSHCTISTNF